LEKYIEENKRELTAKEIENNFWGGMEYIEKRRREMSPDEYKSTKKV
jgi:hypothetical protein